MSPDRLVLTGAQWFDLLLMVLGLTTLCAATAVALWLVLRCVWVLAGAVGTSIHIRRRLRRRDDLDGVAVAVGVVPLRDMSSRQIRDEVNEFATLWAINAVDTTQWDRQR